MSEGDHVGDHAGNDVFTNRLLETSPLYHVLVRTAECLLLRDYELPSPVLDIGCGPGTFGRALFGGRQVDAGIDPQHGELLQTQALGGYRWLVQCMGAQLPFRDQSFASSFSNSTLEHIPEVEPVLEEMHRVVVAGGPVLITVPSEHFLPYYGGSQLLESLRLKGPAASYRRWQRGRARVHHDDPPDVWLPRLANAGFSVKSWRYYYSKANMALFDLSHYMTIPSLVTRRLLGRWVLWPGKRKVLPLARLLRRWVDPGPDDEGAFLLFNCTRNA